MSNYDITMKQYNGTDYDSLYPKTVSQQVALNNSNVAESIGLTMPNPTILDAVSKVQTNLNWAFNVLSTAVVGTYTGDGTYGTANKTSLTFNFIPKLVIVHGYHETAIFIHGNPSSNLISFSDASNIILGVSWNDNDKKVEWYTDMTTGVPDRYQLNIENMSYYYFACS